MKFGLAGCICEHCGCVDECEYFKETVEPIIKAVDMTITRDEFISEIIHALSNFKCEYFE
jgi:hypothetical protein